MAKNASKYSMYEPEDLRKRWQRGDLTVYQAIGQLVLHLIALVKQFAIMKASQQNFEQRLRVLEARRD